MAAPVTAPAATGPEAWATGYCNCFADVPTCLIVCCLGPCVTYGQNVDALRGSGFCGPCCAYFCLAIFGCPCIVASGFRTELRKKYNLREDPCNDCISHFPCCSACAVCQEAYEIKVRTARGQ